MKQQSITVGVIGCGYWGSIILKELSTCSPQFHIAACVDGSADARNRIHALYPDIPMFTKTADMYASIPCDAVIIATPPETHLSLVAEALEQKKHVWVEKPVTLHNHDVDGILALQKKAHRTVFVDHTYRYDEGIGTLATIVRQKSTGPIYEMRSVRTGDGIFRTDGSVAWDLLVHDLTIGSMLFGTFPNAVSASGSAYRKNKPMDTMLIHLSYPQNRHMYVTLSWQAAYKTRYIELIGPTSMISYTEQQTVRDIRIYQKTQTGWQKKRMRHIQLTHQSLYHALVHFAMCVKNGIRPMTGLTEGEKVIRMLEAVDQSVKCGGTEINL